ncbi:MAG: HNH endonuclease [Austwickia sp.]|nr:HNH endonuclease [Austwickia sp.]
MSSTDTFAPTPVAGLSSYEATRWLEDAVRRVGLGLRHLTGGADGSLGLGDVLALLPTDDLAGLFGDLVALRALAEGASAAVLAEAVARGVVAASDDSPRPIGPRITAWVQDQAAAAGAPVTAGVAGTYRTCWEQSRRPELAPLTAAVRDGRISLTVGARLGADLSTLAVKIPTDWWEAAAGELIAHAATGASASQLGSLKEALIASYGDEGDFEEQQKELHRQRRFTTPVKDGTGMWVGRYAMTNDDYAALKAALDALAAPTPTADGEVDTRTAEQRNLDAIIEMARIVATDPTLSGHVRPGSAAKAQIIITIDHDLLAEKVRAYYAQRTSQDRAQRAGQDCAESAGHDHTESDGDDHTESAGDDCAQPRGQDGAREDSCGVQASRGGAGSTGSAGSASSAGSTGSARSTGSAGTAGSARLNESTGRGAGRGYGLDGFGTPLTPATVRRLACDARIIPAVLGTDGAVLDLGRASRLASPDQVRYLRLRDGCCTFPGCDRPSSWCEAHHLREWTTDLGETNVDNLALLCTRHHTDVHTRGLAGRLVDGAIRWSRRQ